MLRGLTEGVDYRDMPAALDVNWEEVKMLAISIGVREAARRMELSEDAVRQRSSREGWLANLPRSQPLPPSMVRPVTVVTSAANLLVQELSDLGGKSRIAVARGLHKGAKEIEQMPGSYIVANATDIQSTVKSLAVIHAWQADRPATKINLHVTGGNVQVEPEQVRTIDAQWSDAEGIGSEQVSTNVDDY